MAPTNKKKQQAPVKGGKKGSKQPQLLPGGGMGGNLISAVLIFLVLMSVYSFFVDANNKPEDVALSQVAGDVRAGLVSAIAVSGDELTLTYVDGAEKKSMKDPDASLSDTLADYGTTPEELAKVAITIKGRSGFQFWFATLAPILVPILFLGVLFWFLARQVKGAGMQAFTFGQSKARMIDPKDAGQRVMFADVAGAKGIPIIENTLSIAPQLLYFSPKTQGQSDILKVLPN